MPRQTPFCYANGDPIFIGDMLFTIEFPFHGETVYGNQWKMTDQTKDAGVDGKRWRLEGFRYEGDGRWISEKYPFPVFYQSFELALKAMLEHHQATLEHYLNRIEIINQVDASSLQSK